MRPIPPPQPKYRIRELNGEFTIEKLVLVAKLNKGFFNQCINGKFNEYKEYQELYENDRFYNWAGILSGKTKIKKFKSLSEADQELKEIKSKTEVKYHNR